MVFQKLNPQDYYLNTVGFDRSFKLLSDMLEGATKPPNYPPYNIVKINENLFHIELALAGFSKDDIKIELNENQLTVSGQHDVVEREYVHKGISEKIFTRTFTLADTVKIGKATMENGILIIELENIIPEHKKQQTIPIV